MGNPRIAEYGAGSRFGSGCEAVGSGRAGGIVSGESKRRKRALSDLASLMMDSPAAPKLAAKAATVTPGVRPEDMTNGAVMLSGQFQAAMKGSTRAAES